MEAEETAAKDHVSKMVYEESGGELMYNNFTTGACLNGGVCIDHPMKFAYLCSCPQGWTGSHCETKVFEASLMGSVATFLKYFESLTTTSKTM